MRLKALVPRTLWKWAGWGSLAVGVLACTALLFKAGSGGGMEAPLAFTSCLPVARPDLSLGEEAKKARAHQLCDQAERVAANSSRDPGALWAALESVQEAAALLALAPSPGALSLRVTDVRGKLIQIQKEEADRLLLEARTCRRRGDSKGSETCLRRLLRLIPDPAHPLHQRIRRELGDW